MSHRDGYPQGVPSWVDLQAKDQAVAKSFYSGLFGWELEDQPLPMGGHYTMAYLDGGSVAGIGSPPPGSPEEMPSVWSTYFAVDDLGDVLSKVEGAGGRVVVPAMQVMEQGSMAMVADPTGAVVGLWQPDRHKGAQTVNQHGAVVWNELITPDPDGAAGFYDAILGTTHETGPMGGDGSDYTVINVDGRSVAGAMSLPEHQNVPPSWSVYFATDDIDATVARAEELGATVLNRVDTPAGPLAVMADPQGAVFQVMQATEIDD